MWYLIYIVLFLLSVWNTFYLWKRLRLDTQTPMQTEALPNICDILDSFLIKKIMIHIV